MSELVSCRYNPSHKVKRSRLMFHEEKCPNKNTNIIKTCLYNPNHKIHKDIFDDHLNTCPDRPDFDKAQQEKLRAYVENKEKQAEINRIINSNTILENNNNNKKTNYIDEKSKDEKYHREKNLYIDEEEKKKEVIFTKEKIRREEKEKIRLINDSDSYNEKSIGKGLEVNIIKREEEEEQKTSERYLNRKTNFDISYKNDEYHSAEDKLYNTEYNNDNNLKNNENSDSDDNSQSQEKKLDYQGEEFNNFF